jgi:hypothetical protein
LLNYHNQELTLNHIHEMRKKSALEEGEDTEPEPNERTMMVLKSTEELGLIEADIKVFEDTDRNEQRAATTGHGIIGIVA